MDGNTTNNYSSIIRVIQKKLYVSRGSVKVVSARQKWDNGSSWFEQAHFEEYTALESNS